jgi:HEAT repeat protein
MTQIEMKKFIHHALEMNDLDAVVLLVQKERKALSLLIRMAYDKETLVGWRAIKAVGRIANVLVKTEHEFLRIAVRRLLWSLSDESGGIGWAAPELLGEIVQSDPEGFADIIPLIAEVYNIEEQTFRPGVVYALARIAEVSPEMIASFQKIIVRSLVDTNPLIRIYALNLIGLLWPVVCNKNLWSMDYKKKIEKLVNNLKIDNKVAWIYQNNGFIDIEVGEHASILVNNLIKYV